MGKIKIIFYLILAYVIYKGAVAIKDFELGLGKKVEEIEKMVDLEKDVEILGVKTEVIGLLMYLGDPLELNEHLFAKSKSKCLKMKEIAEQTSNAYYECAKVSAIVKAGKIVSVIEEIEVLE
tara:strand:- start:140 stop:505 length:366 start_codon:yes stop_codon:yes gene_type:complete